MIIGVPLELRTGEKRVALSPGNVAVLVKKNIKVLIQSNAGQAAGFLDSHFEEAGAQIVTSREEIFSQSEIVLQVQSFGSNQENSDSDLDLLREGQVIAGMMDPLANPQNARTLAERKVSAIAIQTLHWIP